MLKLRRILTIALIDGVGVCLTKLSPWLNTQYISLLVNHHFLNLSNPKTFPEKLSWLKLHDYNSNKLVKQCADKFLVRNYVESKGLGYMLNELISVYEDVDDIIWEQLPNAFVLKWNFGSGYNLLCNDKSCLSKELSLKQLKNWQDKKFWMFFSEMHYKVDKKYILCERYLQTAKGSLIDYKFYCFHGIVRAVLVIERVNDVAERAVFMSPEWEFMADVNYKYKDFFIPKRPIALEDMVRASEILSEDFPFVRVDFYEFEGKPIFGEMTFTPSSGINPSETLINNVNMGDFV